MNSGNHRIVDHFFFVGISELVEITNGEFEPTRKGIATNHRGANR